jgi:hypothetical protein
MVNIATSMTTTLDLEDRCGAFAFRMYQTSDTLSLAVSSIFMMFNNDTQVTVGYEPSTFARLKVQSRTRSIRHIGL